VLIWEKGPEKALALAHEKEPEKVLAMAYEKGLETRLRNWTMRRQRRLSMRWNSFSWSRGGCGLRGRCVLLNNDGVDGGAINLQFIRFQRREPFTKTQCTRTALFWGYN
jgi:hypothetical protein